MTPPAGPTVLFVDNCALPSGAQLALEGLLRSLAARDDVELAGLVVGSSGPMVERWAKFVETEQITQSASSGLSRHGLRPSALPGLLRESTGVRRSARRFRRRHTDGIVYFNTLRSFAVARPLLPRSVPVVVHVRDRLEGYFGALPTKILLRSLRRADAVIANSEGTAGEYVSAGLPRSKVTVVPSPLRAEFLVHHDQAASRDRRLLAIVGTISPWKGPHLAIRAALALRDEGIGVTLHLIGAPLFGEIDYERRLRDEAGGEAGRSIVFHGHVDDVADHLDNLGVGCLVHASTLPEPLGMAVVEGMALGLAVVATDTGGPLELIDHGHNGFLFETGNSDSLVSNLKSAIGPAGEKVAARAPMSIRARFDPTGISERTLGVLRNCDV